MEKSQSESHNQNIAGRNEVVNVECYQEDALLADDYGIEQDGPYKTDDQKLILLQAFKSQADNKEYCPKTLREVHPNVEVVNSINADGN